MVRDACFRRVEATDIPVNIHRNRLRILDDLFYFQNHDFSGQIGNYDSEIIPINITPDRSTTLDDIFYFQNYDFSGQRGSDDSEFMYYIRNIPVRKCKTTYTYQYFSIMLTRMSRHLNDHFYISSLNESTIYVINFKFVNGNNVQGQQFYTRLVTMRR